MVGADFRHFKQRRNQPIRRAAMIHTFAHRINARVSQGLHGVVHDDATGSRADLQARFFGKCGVRANTHRHHYQISRNLFAAFKAKRRHATGFARDERLGLCPHLEFNALGFERTLQQLAGFLIKLALHEPRHHVHHDYIHAAQFETVCGFQSKQAAANDYGFFVNASRVNHRLCVGNVAIRNHAR